MSKIIRSIQRAIETGETSRYQLSKLTGIGQSHLAKLMNGTAKLSIDNLELLADALGLEIIVRPKRRKGK